MKVRRSEPVTWSPVAPVPGQPQLSQEKPDSVVSGTMKTVKSVRSQDSDQDTPEQKLSITLAGNQGLGCSICKVSQTQHSLQIRVFESDSKSLSTNFPIYQCSFPQNYLLKDPFLYVHCPNVQLAYENSYPE